MIARVSPSRLKPCTAGETTEQISVLLAPKLDNQVPEQERVQFVADVAKTLGIPDGDQAGGDQAFSQWEAQRAQATQATPAQANAATPEATPTSAAPVQNDAQSLSELVRREAQWRQTMPLSEAEVLSSDTIMVLRAEDHVMWIIATPDNVPEGLPCWPRTWKTRRIVRCPRIRSNRFTAVFRTRRKTPKFSTRPLHLS